MSEYSILDKIACLDRELAMRRNVYASQIRRGVLSASKAQREIGIMAAIREDYLAWQQSQFSTESISAPKPGSDSTSAALQRATSTKS